MNLHFWVEGGGGVGTVQCSAVQLQCSLFCDYIIGSSIGRDLGYLEKKEKE